MNIVKAAPVADSAGFFHHPSGITECGIKPLFLCPSEPERDTLTMQEIIRLYQKPLLERLDHVRNIFLFACVTTSTNTCRHAKVSKKKISNNMTELERKLFTPGKSIFQRE